MKYFYILIIGLSIMLSGCGSTANLINDDNLDYRQTITIHNNNYTHIYYIKGNMAISSELYFNRKLLYIYTYHYVNDSLGIDKQDKHYNYIDFEPYEYINLIKSHNSIKQLKPVLIHDEYRYKTL